MTSWQIAGIIVAIIGTISGIAIALWKIHEYNKAYFDKKIEDYRKDLSKGNILCMVEFEKLKDTVWKRYDDQKNMIKKEYLRIEIFDKYETYISKDFSKVEETMKEMRADSIRLEAKIDKILMSMEIK